MRASKARAGRWHLPQQHRMRPRPHLRLSLYEQLYVRSLRAEASGRCVQRHRSVQRVRLPRFSRRGSVRNVRSSSRHGRTLPLCQLPRLHQGYVFAVERCCLSVSKRQRAHKKSSIGSTSASVTLFGFGGLNHVKGDVHVLGRRSSKPPCEHSTRSAVAPNAS